MDAFARASNVLASATSPPADRARAEAHLQGIAALGDPAQVVALVKSVCSAAPAAPEHSKFHAICLLRDLFLRRHAEPAARACVDGALAWLMNGLLNSGAAAVGPLVRALRQCAAVLCKLQLMAGPAFTSGAVVSVCDGLQSQSGLSAERQCAAMQLLCGVMGELSEPHGGLSLEAHEQCHRAYQRAGLLDRTLQAALTRVQRTYHAVAQQSPHRGSGQLRDRLMPLLTASMRLLQRCLAWDFRWHGSPAVTSTLPKLRPPAGWKGVLLQQNVAGLVARVCLSLGNVDDIREAAEACLLHLAGLNGPVFGDGDERSDAAVAERAAFIDALLQGVLRATTSEAAVWWSASVVCQALGAASRGEATLLAALPREGAVLGDVANMTLQSLTVVSARVGQGASLEDVDMLARAVDSLLGMWSTSILALEKKARGSDTQSPVPGTCQRLLAQLAPLFHKMHDGFVNFALAHAPRLLGGRGSSDGSAVLDDAVAAEARHCAMGVLGRTAAARAVEHILTIAGAEVQGKPPDLWRLATLIRLATHLLVQHNKSMVHRLVPQGIRKVPQATRLIESLVHIVAVATQAWSDQQQQQQQPAHALLALTRETSAAMVSFSQVYIDPLTPSGAAGALCPELEAAIKGDGMGQIVRLLVQFATSVLASAGGARGTARGTMVLTHVEDATQDLGEVQGAIDLLDRLVRRSAGHLSSSGGPWQSIVAAVAEGVSPSHQGFMCGTSPFTFGKVLEYVTRASMHCPQAPQYFGQISSAIARAVSQLEALPISSGAEPTALRTIESVRGMLRCALQKGCGWSPARTARARQLGWAASVPLLGKLNVVAARWCAALPATTVLPATVRLWAHMLKVYGNTLNAETFSRMFVELERLLGMFQSTQAFLSSVAGVAGPPSAAAASVLASSAGSTATVICRFASLLIELMMTQRTVLAQAFGRKQHPSPATASSSPQDNLGSRVIAVCFATVERLFVCITPGLLGFPKLCERFVGLSCLLVELFPGKLLATNERIVSQFLSCLEFAAGHHTEEVSDGALDAVQALLRGAAVASPGARRLVVSRFVAFVLRWMVKSTVLWGEGTTEKTYIGLLHTLMGLESAVVNESAAAFCSGFPAPVQPRLRACMGELFVGHGREELAAFETRCHQFIGTARRFTRFA